MQKKLHLSVEGFSALQSYPPHSVYYNIIPSPFFFFFSFIFQFWPFIWCMTINLGCSRNFFLLLYTTIVHDKDGSQITILISICHLEHIWYLFLTLWNNRIWLEALNNTDHSPTKQGPSVYHLKVKLVQRPQLLPRLV